MANLVFRPPSLRSAFFGLSRLVRAPRILTANRGYSENANPGSKEHIDSLVSAKKLVLFMKGTPEAPRCGFSNLVIQIFKFHGVEDFQAHNVLEDEDLRQGIKDYSNWPTIPQVYMDGEFVGGCDIMLEKHKSGELIEDLSKIGIRSAVLDLEEEKEDEGKENDKK